MCLKILQGMLFTSLLVACEQDPNPFVEDEFPFTIYGFLDPTAERQHVKVIPLAPNINAVGDGAERATVISTNLASGEHRVWQDSMVTFADGDTGTVFFSDFTPSFEEAYRLEVIDVDGEVSSAEVVIPPQITARRKIDSDPLAPTYVLERETLPTFVQVGIQYEAASLQAQLLPPILYPVLVSYQGEERRIGNSWEYSVNYRHDFRFIRDAFDEVCLRSDFISVRTIRFVFFVGNQEWASPLETFDIEQLVQPGTFSNVENGFGFFGAGYEIFFSIPLSDKFVDAGFKFDPPCRPEDELPLDDPLCTIIPPCFEEATLF